MLIKQLNIYHVRNITHAKIILHSRFNCLTGANGSGKTSILESLFLLSTGHSFRTREITPLIQYGQQQCTVFARTFDEETISIQKSLSSPTVVKLNQQTCTRNSILARFLPCQVFYQDMFHIMDAGPSVRRRLLDWGVFHVKHEYQFLYQQYQQVLKQRNALLRTQANEASFQPWNALLVDLGNQIDALRRDYFEKWAQEFQQTLHRLTDIDCAIHYFKGWDKKQTGQSLATVLSKQFYSDCQRQFTQSGPHQADIWFELPMAKKSKLVLSRGQQKIILIAMKLAQAQLINGPCLYLLDDITAELDSMHFHQLLSCLQQQPGQFVLTGLDADIFSSLVKDDVFFYKVVNGELSCST